MANYAEGINPDVLRWARERAGYSLSQVAKALKKEVDDVSEWEQGESVPTYGQLEALAYRYYKRPIALFFFPSPPPETDPREEFRTLPDFEITNLLPDTRHAIREGLAMQQSLRELTDSQNPAESLVFNDLILTANQSVAEAAQQLREYLRTSVEDQSKWSGTSEALDAWRREVQNVGVFIFKRSFKQQDVSGYSLYDPEFPLIYLNNSTAKSRQQFTMFHELAHILLRSSGITKTDLRYIDSLSGENKSIEVFCNSFAAEFLVPASDFRARYDPDQDPERTAETLANFYNVSREVILRKLLDRDVVTRDYYEEMAKRWTDEFGSHRRKGTGGNYYATKAAYLGDRYLNLAFSKYYEGRLSHEQLAGYLNIKAKNLEGLERQMLSRASAQ